VAAVRKKVSTTTHIGAEQLEALRMLSVRTHVPEYIRQGVDEILKRYEYVFDDGWRLFQKGADHGPRS
jgi:hypothetical protein